MSYTNTSTMSLFNNFANSNVLQFPQKQQICQQSAISKATIASQQAMAVDNSLSVLQSMCQLNAQFASVQTLVQLRSAMTQLNAQLLAMAPQMDAVNKQLQSLRQKQSQKPSNLRKLGLPLISVDTDDCVSVASDDECKSTSSMSPSVSPSMSPCPSYRSSSPSPSLSLSTFPVSPSFSISSGNSDTLSVISDCSESGCEVVEAPQYSVDAMWERKPLCSAMQKASAEDLVHSDSKADIAKVACDRVKGTNMLLALRKAAALRRASKNKKCTRSTQQH